MPAAAAHPFRSVWLHRVLAVGAAGLVLALTIFAASPSGHAALHAADADHHEDDYACAVELFASGVALPLGPFAVIPPLPVAPGLLPMSAGDASFASPRYLLQPERGPPASLVL